MFPFCPVGREGWLKLPVLRVETTLIARGSEQMVAKDDGVFPFLNEELFGTPESSKLKGRYDS